MPIDKRKSTDIYRHESRFLSTHFSTHIFYLLLIIISISWNGYNTYQYRILIERQTKLENILTEFLPSSSSIPLFHHQPTTIERWIDRITYFIHQLTLNEKIQNNRTAKTHITVRRKRRYVEEPSTSNCLCPPSSQGEKGDRGFAGFPGEMGPKGERGHPGSIVWNGIKGEKGEPGHSGGSSGGEVDSPYETKVIQGPPGAPGSPGPPGRKGEMGAGGHNDISNVGPPGQDGLPGQKGDRGEQGIQGPPGMQGDRGDEGKRGFRGRPGSPGPAGMDALPCPRELLLNYEKMCSSCCGKS